MNFLTFGGRGDPPAHGNILANLGFRVGLGRNPQKGVALSNATPLTNSGVDAAKHSATYPPNEFPTT